LLPPPPLAKLAAKSSLFLDFDGTLIELAQRPDAIVVDAGLRDLLGMLAERLDARLAIVSGRSIAQLDHFLGPVTAALAGSHGVERRLLTGRIDRPPPPVTLDRATEAVRRFVAAHPGSVLEEKSHGVGLHYRSVPEIEAEAHRFAARLATEHGLAVQIGKMMVELKPEGDKGQAIAALLAEPPMAGTRPIFLGDDLTDETGFAIVEGLGGIGVLVGPLRETKASRHLPDVASVRAWLAEGFE
jgi:trehalose 6-phosphate phosphatase